MKSITLVALALTLSPIGCEQEAAKPAPPARSGAAGNGTAFVSQGTSSQAPASAIADWSEIDLSSSGVAWKGWAVKAPPGATIKKSFDGLEIAKGGYGIQVSFTATSLASTVSTVKEGVNYDQKPEILTQTKELVEWSSTFKSDGANKTMYGFHLLVKTAGVTMGCKQASGVYDRAKLAPMEEACRTLHKK